MNLFPAPKKPIASYRNPRSPNPAHHNYNRIQNFNQQLTSKLSWLKLQCAGADGNLGVAKIQLTSLFGKDFHKLPPEDQQKLREIIDKVAGIRAELKLLADNIGNVNREKTKLTKEQMEIPDKK